MRRDSSADRLAWPDSAELSIRGRVADDVLLARRLGAGAALVLAPIVVLGVRDVVLGGDHLRVLLAVKAVQITTLLLAAWLCREPDGRLRALPVAIVTGVILCVGTALTGILRGDALTPPLLFLILLMAMAAMLPWKGIYQSIAVAVATLSSMATVYFIAGSLRPAITPWGVAFLAGFATSIYISFEFERYRREIDRRTQALRSSEERRAAIIRAIPITLHRSDVSQPLPRCTWISDNAERLLGFPAARFLDDDSTWFWIDRIHPDDSENVFASLRDLISSGTASVEYRWRCGDGEYHWFLHQLVLVRDDSGTGHEVVGSWQDITERRCAADAARRSEKYFRAVIENSSDLIAILEADGTIRYISPSVTALLGYRPQDWLGRSAFDFVHLHDRPSAVGGFRRVVNGVGRAEPLVFRLGHRDGSWRFVEAKALTCSRTRPSAESSCTAATSPSDWRWRPRCATVRSAIAPWSRTATS